MQETVAFEIDGLVTRCHDFFVQKVGYAILAENIVHDLFRCGV